MKTIINALLLFIAVDYVTVNHKDFVVIDDGKSKVYYQIPKEISRDADAISAYVLKLRAQYDNKN